MEGLYFIDPLSIASNGFDLFDQYSDALSVASLGFIKFKITSITIRRTGDGNAGGFLPPIKIWKDLESREEVPELDKVKEIFSNFDAREIEITLEPLNSAIKLEPLHLDVLKEEFKKIFFDFEIISNDNYVKEEKNEISIILQKIDNI